MVYCDFDIAHSMRGLVKTRSDGKIVLKGQSNSNEMKMMLIASTSGQEISLSSVFENLSNKAVSLDGQLIVDRWIELDQDTKFYFLSVLNTRCVVESWLCRYTAFAYVISNGDVNVYECDNAVVTHKAYVDIKMPISYSVTRKIITPKKKFLNANKMVDSGYYEVKFNCEDKNLYKIGYVEYLCCNTSIPITSSMIKQGFFVKNTNGEPKLITNKVFIELTRS